MALNYRKIQWLRHYSISLCSKTFFFMEHIIYKGPIYTPKNTDGSVSSSGPQSIICICAKWAYKGWLDVYDKTSFAGIEGSWVCTDLPRSRKGFSLLSTSVHCRLISSSIIDSANLQDWSSLKARVHLPSTKGFGFDLSNVLDLVGSLNGRFHGRMRKCNHFGCLSSILGWWRKKFVSCYCNCFLLI